MIILKDNIMIFNDKNKNVLLYCSEEPQKRHEQLYKPPISTFPLFLLAVWSPACPFHIVQAFRWSMSCWRHNDRKKEQEYEIPPWAFLSPQLHSDDSAALYARLHSRR